MKIKSLLLALVLVFSVSGLFAHALWIQTSSSAKKGESVTVKVFFGEYSDHKPDSAAHWFSNLSRFKLVLTSPDGQQQILPTKAEIFDHVATFTPNQDGIYTLSIVHQVADVYSGGRIDYYAFADVSVGKPKNSSLPPSDAILAFRKSADLSYSLSHKQAALGNQKVELVDPSNKKIELITNDKGQLNFKPTLKGGYFLESMVEEKATGELKGKPYEKVWHIATYFTQKI